MSVRKPAVAGMFYTDDPEALHQEIQGYLHQAGAKCPPSSGGRGPLKPQRGVGPAKALIAPHAGTIYSGPIAATAYATLIPIRAHIKKVVLLGPDHHVGFIGLAAPSVDFFETPLGKIPIDQASIQRVASLPQVKIFNEAHAKEHSLELHLPFLQEVLEDFSLIPLVVGQTKPQEVAEVLETLWGGPETLIVVSSDLSHYKDYASAQKIDLATSQAIENLEYETLHHEQTCGYFSVCGLLLAAQNHGLKGKTVDLRNSGDTAGDKAKVVGYGAYLFS